jgi:NitT/TauT family transport system substrate-binding protein
MGNGFRENLGKILSSRLPYFLSLLLIAVCTLTSCEVVTTQKSSIDQVTLQLKWTHQTQFAGFYVADDKGFYRDENIEVTFLEGGEEVDNAENLLSGKADFGVLSPESIIVNRSRGEPLLAIASIYRRSAVVFVSMADSGIVRPADMLGKTIAITNEYGAMLDFAIQFYALMNKLGLDCSNCTIVNMDPSYEIFYRRETDVTATYAIGGLLEIRQKGYKVNTIWPSDYGIHFYSDTLATTDRLADENPDLVTRFLRASLRGWEDAVEDYEMAVEITMKYAPNSDRQLQLATMEALLPLVHTGEDRLGWMKPERWQGMYDILLDGGLLEAPFDIRDAYTMRFLDEVYGVEQQ